MNAGNADEPNEPTEKNPSNNPVPGPGANVLLKLALLSKLIDELTFGKINGLLRLDPAFDVRGYLERTVGLDPHSLDELVRFETELLESFDGDTARIDESLTEAIQAAEEFEKTFASNPAPDDLFIPPGSFDAVAETVEDTYGKKREGDNTDDDHSRGSNQHGFRIGFFESTRYRILHVISEGGQAIVFRAWDIELKSFVAIKTIRLKKFFELSPRAQIVTCERFVQEALITRRLTHPSVIPIYALDRWPVRNQELGLDHLPNGIPFLVLPFYPKGDLSKEIEKLHDNDESKKLDESESDLLFGERIDSLIQVCRAVALGHERGIIHRDIKPKNILVGHHGEVYLADWGIAKILRNVMSDKEDPETREFSVRSGSEQTEWGYYGTFAYMSPEQANGDVHMHNHATDIFLIGATIYTMAYGQAPYASKDPHETRRLAANCEVNWSRPVLPGVDDSLIRICKKAMSREQSDRFETAMDLASELQRWRADLPLREVKESLRRKASRFLKRHSRSLAAATVVSLLGTGGLIISNYRISEARDIAVAAEKTTGIALINTRKAEEITKQALIEKSEALVAAKAAGEAEKKAKEEALASKDEALAANRVAQQNFAQVAQLAIELLKVVAQKLAPIPGLAELRLEIAENLAGNLAKIAFAPQNARNPDIFILHARAEREAGNIARFIGKFDIAKKHYLLAQRVLEGVIKSYAQRPRYQADLALLLDDRATLAQMQGDNREAEQFIKQADLRVDIVRKLQNDPTVLPGFKLKDTEVDEVEFAVLIHESGFLGQLGRDLEQREVLDRLDVLANALFPNPDALSRQQFVLSITSKAQRAEHSLRTKNPDAAIASYRAAFDMLQAKRKKVEAEKKPFEPDDLNLLGDTLYGLADALRQKADPASIREASDHLKEAYRIHEKLDREARGALSYLDNLLWDFALIRLFQREHDSKFEGVDILNDQAALDKLETLFKAADSPDRRSLRAHILAEMAYRADPPAKEELARKAAADFDAVLEKLPNRTDHEQDREKFLKDFPQDPPKPKG